MTFHCNGTIKVGSADQLEFLTGFVSDNVAQSLGIDIAICIVNFVSLFIEYCIIGPWFKALEKRHKRKGKTALHSMSDKEKAEWRKQHGIEEPAAGGGDRKKSKAPHAHNAAHTHEHNQHQAANVGPHDHNEKHKHGHQEHSTPISTAPITTNLTTTTTSPTPTATLVTTSPPIVYSSPPAQPPIAAAQAQPKPQVSLSPSPRPVSGIQTEIPPVHVNKEENSKIPKF